MSNTDLNNIKQTLVNISKGNNILDMLLEFERTLDNLEVFAYKNWINGELVDGPRLSRYFITTTWMYPYSMMPDPSGGLRLTKIGAKVNFKKGIFKRPRKVKGPEDWVDPQSKRAKMVDTKVWLVTIEMPIKYINHAMQDIDDVIEKDIQNTNDELAGAFEEDIPVDDVSQEVPDVDMPEEEI